jgi:hypothetical protein
MSMICSSSDWNNSRCGYFGSLFGRIVFPSFYAHACFYWGILNSIFVGIHRHLCAFYRFFRIDYSKRPHSSLTKRKEK